MDGSFGPLRFPVATPPRPGDAVADSARSLVAAHAAALRARPHQFVAARRRARLDHCRLRLRDARSQSGLGAHLCRASRRPSGDADHRHALPSRPYRARRLARRALAGAAVDHRKGMALRPGDEPGQRRFCRAAPRFRPPRRARRRRQRIVRRARKKLPRAACRRCRRPFGASPTAWRSGSAGGSGGSSSARATRQNSPVFIAPRPAC